MVRVLLALPSFETSVCDRETRRFNQEAAVLGEEVRVFAISHDLPLTQKRWCAAADVERVITLSDHVLGEFGPACGTLMKELRLPRRASFVVDGRGMLVYAGYMASNGDEPDHAAVLEVARAAL
ncbi:MAG TPA: redoxin domain-containing protein [Chloroflexi bacterium]|nr:redoxin domain-containing protein [Chloroflexota bacterium]